MAVLARVFALLLLAAPSIAVFAADLGSVDDEQINQLVENIGSSDLERKHIRERLTGWKEILSSPKDKALGDPDKLKLVNDFMYETPFYCDPVMWCMEDYWAKPVEFLANDGGDCEDFSIAKYFTLKALGVPDEKLRIVYAIYRRGTFTGAHMVLAYYPTPDAEPLILDNINPDILPSSKRPDITPIFGFNSAGLWQAQEQKGRGKPTDYYRSWGDQWRQVQSETAFRSVTPAQRKTPECRAIITRSPWCR